MSVSRLFFRWVLEPYWDFWERSPRLKTFSRLQKSQWYPTQRILAEQGRALQMLVKHAVAQCPFYRERFDSVGIDPNHVRGITDLAGLPLVTKDDIRANTPKMIADGYSVTNLQESRTGGSTGEALTVYCDMKGAQIRGGSALRADHWSGWRLGEPIAALWGNPEIRRTWRQRIYQFLRTRGYELDTAQLDDEAVARFLKTWNRFKPGMLFGHAHSIYRFAEMVQKLDLELRPKAIVSTSMMLLEKERRLIEEVFQTKVTNRYGCEEVSLIACECEHHKGMHINAEQIVLEVLREDGSPCEPGEDGFLVVTDLVNYGMPFIRYKVGDRGTLADAPCPCGRGLPVLAGLTGRVADFLVAQNGMLVAGISLIERTLTRIPGIKQLQLIQNKRQAVQVNMVPDSDFSPQTHILVEAELKTALGADFRVTITNIDEIKRDRAGKYRFAICEIQG